jgi:uncharacterized protein (TIGR03437 family)
VSFSSPARTSETITLFLTGLGAVNGTVQAGILPPAGVAAVAPVQITIGNVVIPSLRGVLSVTSPGTYQVQVQVPSGLRGSAAVQATANSVVSNTPILWIASV